MATAKLSTRVKLIEEQVLSGDITMNIKDIKGLARDSKELGGLLDCFVTLSGIKQLKGDMLTGYQACKKEVIFSDDSVLYRDNTGYIVDTINEIDRLTSRVMGGLHRLLQGLTLDSIEKSASIKKSMKELVKYYTLHKASTRLGKSLPSMVEYSYIKGEKVILSKQAIKTATDEAKAIFEDGWSKKMKKQFKDFSEEVVELLQSEVA